MKNQKPKIVTIMTFVVIFLSFTKVFAQPSCTYVVFNTAPCSVSGTVDYWDPVCNCICNTQTFTIPAGSSQNFTCGGSCNPGLISDVTITVNSIGTGALGTPLVADQANPNPSNQPVPPVSCTGATSVGASWGSSSTTIF